MNACHLWKIKINSAGVIKKENTNKWEYVFCNNRNTNKMCLAIVCANPQGTNAMVLSY
jgi:hypothetical protein